MKIKVSILTKGGENIICFQELKNLISVHFIEKSIYKGKNLEIYLIKENKIDLNFDIFRYETLPVY